MGLTYLVIIENRRKICNQFKNNTNKLDEQNRAKRTFFSILHFFQRQVSAFIKTSNI